MARIRDGPVLIAAASNGKTLWYLTRGTGLVALVLLSVSVALGVTEVNRWARPSWPRFVTAGLHKNVSLLSTVFLAVHIATSIFDAFAPIRWIEVVIPFISKYRPIWLGLGAVAVDLLIAIVITSLIRQRIGYRAWKLVHWTSYACWPTAMVHALGTGSDSRHNWALIVYGISLAVVVVSVWWRLATGWTTPARTGRLVAVAGSVAVPLLIVGFFVVGPGRSGWAARAGTPKSLIASANQPVTASSVPAAAPVTFSAPFTDQMRGTIAQSTPNASGQSTVTINATLTGTASGVIQVALTGAADPNGGITMSSSSAALGPASNPRLYRGQVTALSGNTFQLGLRDAAGQSLTVSARLTTNDGGVVAGVVQAS